MNLTQDILTRLSCMIKMQLPVSQGHGRIHLSDYNRLFIDL